MRRSTAGTTIFLLLSSGALAVALADDRVTGRVSVGAGVKNLDSGWEPLGDQTAFVLSLTIGKASWPVQVAFDYASATDEQTRFTGFPLIPPFCCLSTETTAESETTEWNLGLRRFWRSDRYFRPYIGGGIAIIEGEIHVEESGFDARDSTTGYWADAGCRLGSGWIEWGFELRYSAGEIHLGEVEVDAGGPQVLLHFGGRW